MADIILAVIILTPFALTFLLKSNAALGFLALCLGFVLSTSVIGDLKNLLSQMDLSMADSTLALTVLVVPIVLTLILTHRTGGKGIKFYLHLLVALCAGVLLALSLEPALNLSGSNDLSNSVAWPYLVDFQALIVGVGGFLSLLLLWFGGLKHPKKKH